jgi:preprotein translocase subunit SecG
MHVLVNAGYVDCVFCILVFLVNSTNGNNLASCFKSLHSFAYKRKLKMETTFISSTYILLHVRESSKWAQLAKLASLICMCMHLLLQRNKQKTFSSCTKQHHSSHTKIGLH